MALARPQITSTTCIETSLKLRPCSASGAPVQAYRVYLGRARDRGRSPVREFELPLHHGRIEGHCKIKDKNNIE